MASQRPPKDPRDMKNLTGVVVSLWHDKHTCIIFIDKLKGKERDLGIFDTTKFEERLEGVSGIDKPTFLGKRVKLIGMIAKPLTKEKMQELEWDKGDWQIVALQPYGSSRSNVELLPNSYYSKGPGKGKFSPTMLYCQQDIPQATDTDMPPENIGQFIHLLRKLIGTWNNFPLEEIANVIRSNEKYSGVSDFFQSQQDIVVFLKRYPQYFSLKDADKTVFIPYSFSRDVFNSFLRANAARSSQSVQKEVVHKLVESVEACAQHVTNLRGHVGQDTPLVLTFGCEAAETGKEGSLTLLQIGTMNGEVFIFDLLATPKKEDMFIAGRLKEILEDKDIIKVMFDCREPQAALFFQFGIVLRNVFDISGAYATIWDQCNVMAGPYRPISFELLETFGLEAHHKTEEQREMFRKEMNENRLFEKRPLTEEMIEYVVHDAKCWVPKLYESLNSLISPLWRPEFQQKVEMWLEESRSEDLQE
ncbi:Egalitarian protein-like [Holothuria leucospilota]|uniref:Egalitarian protein-like n=1 Tax=Holothuria leucospilota TaxID=206669 RepID=A0A9Q1HJH9_HOLLE|nr:Egalitarian protein-like [Holothuria leucospilota]